MQTLTTKDFKKIVLEETPLIDVRAPIEFSKGAFLNAVNLPIMDDEDRHVIGTCYKEYGNEKAIALGHKRVSGEIRTTRTNSWVNFFNQYPHALIYCFRGGSRSRLSQEWIQEALNREIIRFDGGYKAFRTYLMEAIDPANISSKPIILGGYTGSGKTIVLRQLPHAIDLEALANHRGSSFGRHVTPQPSQINFENNLAYKIIQHEAKNFKTMVLEDEGKHVGTNFIPKPLYDYFNTGKLVVLDVPLEERVHITLDEYVIQAQSEHIKAANNHDMGLHSWYTYITESINRTQKRLGGARHAEILKMIDTAYALQQQTGSYANHEHWIHIFLKDYYDPMYAYQLKNTTKEIIFRGSTSEVTSYLKASL